MRSSESSKTPRDGRRRSPAAALLCGLAVLLVPASASAAAEPAPPGFFGVTESLMSEADFDLLKQSDGTTFRTVFPFSGLKVSRNAPYDWTTFDNYVRQTAYRGIELMPNLYGVPPWISKDRSANPITSKGAAEEWRLFVTAMVQRYGPGGDFWNDYYEQYTPYRPIETWQIWNEPNSITWWAPRPNPKQYATLLQRSADAIHAVDPTARIMTAGIVAKPTNRHAIVGTKYMKKLFAQSKARAATDVLAFHPFAASVRGVRKQMLGARKLLNRSGLGATPIWVTEIGWGTKGPENHALIKSKKGQVRALQDTFEMALKEREKLKLERLFWYHWRDYRDDLCRWCESSGLVTGKLAPKPLFHAFKEIANP